MLLYLGWIVLLFSDLIVYRHLKENKVNHNYSLSHSPRNTNRIAQRNLMNSKILVSEDTHSISRINSQLRNVGSESQISFELHEWLWPPLHVNSVRRGNQLPCFPAFARAQIKYTKCSQWHYLHTFNCKIFRRFFAFSFKLHRGNIDNGHFHFNDRIYATFSHLAQSRSFLGKFQAKQKKLKLLRGAKNVDRTCERKKDKMAQKQEISAQQSQENKDKEYEDDIPCY